MNVYWVETEDHSEGWFVVADSNSAAVQFFAVQKSDLLMHSYARKTFECEISI